MIEIEIEKGRASDSESQVDILAAAKDALHLQERAPSASSIINGETILSLTQACQAGG